MRFVLFSGTTEGRTLSHALAELGGEVLVSVATEYGASLQGNLPGITVHTGRLSAGEIAALLRGAALCIDATHPYAREATAQIRQGAALAQVPYLRLLRPGSGLPQGCTSFPSAQAAAEWLETHPGRVLLTTGTKELPAFASLGGARLYPRVLPSMEALSACELAGIPQKNIIAMQGPFTTALNRALLEQFQIDYLVTKDGGATGGFPEKVEAAQAAGVHLLLIRRPAEEGASYDQVLAWCRALLEKEAGPCM